jgi:hypothetical protein
MLAGLEPGPGQGQRTNSEEIRNLGGAMLVSPQIHA